MITVILLFNSSQIRMGIQQTEPIPPRFRSRRLGEGAGDLLRCRHVTDPRDIPRQPTAGLP